MIGSYWKSANLGDPKLNGFFSGSKLRVEEKIDGSQFSFAKINGEVMARSRNKMLDLNDVEQMFRPAVEHVLSVNDLLPDNIIFRSETLYKNRHNGLTYSRVPCNHICVFDAENAVSGETLSRDMVRDLANAILVDSVPLFDEIEDAEQINLYDYLAKFLERESYLGGAKIEGVVIKRLSSPMYYYDRPLFAKLVSKDFRELQQKTWTKDNPKSGDAVEMLVEELTTPQRFRKAVQHLSEGGKITGELKDIGPLIAEVRRDIEEECAEYIKTRLHEILGKKISIGVGRAVPSWYKADLLAKAGITPDAT